MTFFHHRHAGGGERPRNGARVKRSPPARRPRPSPSQSAMAAFCYSSYTDGEEGGKKKKEGGSAWVPSPSRSERRGDPRLLEYRCRLLGLTILRKKKKIGLAHYEGKGKKQSQPPSRAFSTIQRKGARWVPDRQTKGARHSGSSFQEKEGEKAVVAFRGRGTRELIGVTSPSTSWPEGRRRDRRQFPTP